MKKKLLSLATFVLPLLTLAQGWPANYGGVMLQGFWWDSFADTRWTKLESQAAEMSEYFDLVWVPQSGWTGSNSSMGYDPLYYFNQRSAFGSQAELKSMIQAFKSHGTGVIADIVVNHRKNMSNWVDFPSETYNGETYQMLSTDICRNDDGGAALTWALTNGYSLSANNDEGEDWGGMRDLDHKSANVQKCVKAYLKYLVDDIGYTGFRYDMVRGFNADHVAEYNVHAGVQFSVGENWSSQSTIQGWINNCTYNGVKQSAAFDFPFRYTVRDVIRGRDDNGTAKNWRDLTYGGLAASSAYKRYAVTFVENHDTQKRSEIDVQDPIAKDTLAANAYLLAMPGTPCVFLAHWKDNKSDIKQMIHARKLAGITNQSTASKLGNANPNNRQMSVFKTNGTKGTLICAVGTAVKYVDQSVLTGFTEIINGYHYRYFLSNSTETAWASVPSSTLTEPTPVTLTAISSTSGAKVVYTLDGSEPTASSPSVASGSSITIDKTCTLKAAVLAGSTVKGTITRNYTYDDNPFVAKTITVHVNIDKAGSAWESGYVNFWSWGGDGSHAPNNGGWPGDKVTATKTVGGKTWYYKEFKINSEEDEVDFVFSTKSGSPQTVDKTGINKDSFFEILEEKDGSNHLIDDVTSQFGGIGDIYVDSPEEQGPVDIYTIDGRKVGRAASQKEAARSLPRGLYIIGHKKVVVR